MIFALFLACHTSAPVASVEPAANDGHTIHGTALSVEAAMEPAWDAVERGDAATADAIASEVVSRVEADPNSGFTRAVAHASHARLRATLGDSDRAIASYERAMTFPPSTEAERKGRLAHISMFVETLIEAGRAPEAVPVARAALEERLTFYAEPEHPGRGYGHRTLADALFAAGDLEGAAAEARRAFSVFQATGHFEVHDVVLLIGEIQVAAGEPVALPEAALELGELREAVALRARLHDAEDLHPVLAVLLERFPDERLHDTRAGLAFRHGDLNGAMASAVWLKANGSADRRFDADMLIAQVLETRGDREGAERAYRETCTDAQQNRSRCLRELGLFLAHEPARIDEAREVLAEAGTSADPEVRGRALIALGILEAHAGATSAARPALEVALTLLPPAHPDAVSARDHLRTLGTGSCGCDDPGASIEGTLKAWADRELPGLVDRVTYDPSRGFEIALARQPTPADQAQLAELQERVLAEVRWRNVQVYGR